MNGKFKGWTEFLIFAMSSLLLFQAAYSLTSQKVPLDTLFNDENIGSFVLDNETAPSSDNSTSEGLTGNLTGALNLTLLNFSEAFFNTSILNVTLPNLTNMSLGKSFSLLIHLVVMAHIENMKQYIRMHRLLVNKSFQSKFNAIKEWNKEIAEELKDIRESKLALVHLLQEGNITKETFVVEMEALKWRLHNLLNNTEKLGWILHNLTENLTSNQKKLCEILLRNNFNFRNEMKELHKEWMETVKNMTLPILNNSKRPCPGLNQNLSQNRSKTPFKKSAASNKGNKSENNFINQTCNKAFKNKTSKQKMNGKWKNKNSGNKRGQGVKTNNQSSEENETAGGSKWNEFS